MTEYLTQEQVVMAVPGLSRARLAAFLQADLVGPALSNNGPVFQPIDLARLQLLCDLADHFEMKPDALGVVIGLIDQLHSARQRLFAMALAIEDEPLDLRNRVGARFVGILAL